jgi:hypothetical protein
MAEQAGNANIAINNSRSQPSAVASGASTNEAAATK